MPGKVLVVEDSHVIQKLIKQVLSLRGFEVISAKNGIEGLEMANKELVDLILVDLLMPEKDGLEFLKDLRNTNGPNSSTKIIVISGNESNLKLADLRDLGVMEIMEKPIDFDKLSLTLEGI